MNSPSVPEQGVAVLLEEYGAVYVEVPKVACSSIKTALADLLGVELESVGGDPHQAHFPAPASPQLGSMLYPGLFSFTFVRNPWDRLVSCYRDKIRGEVPDFTSFDRARGVAYCLARFDAFRPGMSFREFVNAVVDIRDDEADEHFRSQHTFVTNLTGEVAVDFVGRFETLERDFQRVCQMRGLPQLTLPRVQAAKTPRRYTDFYTEETRSIVANRFRKDVVLFSYEFGDE